MTKANECTCPSGDGSLRHPCPAHPVSVEQAGGDERAAFEYWASDEGLYPKAVERAGNCYKLAQTQSYWMAWQARAALAQPSPVRSSLLINGYQLRAALDFIAPDGTAEQLESEACIEWRQQDADFLEAGLYAFCAEYPEEGGVLLDEEPTTAQPSPLQSEQAEAERPEVVGYLATAEHPKHGQPHKAFNYFKDQHDAQVAHWRERGCEVSDDELMTVAQHGRIVGALRARNEKLEADAGALEWLRSTFKVHKAIVEQAGCGTIEQLAEQRDAANSRLHEVSVACATAEQERDAALARIAELEAALSSALSQHGVKFMDPPDGGDTPLIEQVCRMSQALSELEKQDLVDVPGPDEIHQMAFEEGQPADDGDGYLFSAEEFDLFVQRLLDSCAAPVAQAQHSVPEEFSFEYRHPNGECHTVTVSREQVINEMPDFLFEALCSKLCNCEPVGETNVVECRCDEYAEEFKLIAAAPGNEGV